MIVPFRTSPDELVALMRSDIQSEVEFYAAVEAKPAKRQGAGPGDQRAQRSPELPNCRPWRKRGCPIST